MTQYGFDTGDRLKNAGVPVKMIRYDGTIHAFSTKGKMLPQAEDALAAASAALATAFAQNPPSKPPCPPTDGGPWGEDKE